MIQACKQLNEAKSLWISSIDPVEPILTGPTMSYAGSQLRWDLSLR